MAKTRLALLVTLLVAGGCSGSAVHTATYATRGEALAAGAIADGRVPAVLPDNAYELRAAYSVNGTGRWGLFNFRPEDADTLRARLDPDELSLAGTVMEIPSRIEWWPLLLRGTLDPERIRTTGLRAYRVKSADLVVAVNWSQGRAYYWKQ